jgi:hypothetical protein
MQHGDPRVLHGEVIKLQALTFGIDVPGGGVGSGGKSGAGGGVGGAHGRGEDSRKN